MREGTLCFLVRRENGEVNKICLGMKKRGFGSERWNGVGGKIDGLRMESVIDAAKREAKEEIGVQIQNLQRVARVNFHFDHNPNLDFFVHVFLVEEWEGEPKESEEMRPEWFSVEEIPYDEMWPADRYWIPEVLSGKKVMAEIVFGVGDKVLKKNIRTVERI